MRSLKRLSVYLILIGAFASHIILPVQAVDAPASASTIAESSDEQPETILFSDDFNREDASQEKDGVENGWGANSAWRADGKKQAFLNDGALRIVTADGASHHAVVFHEIEPAAQDWTIKIRYRMKPGEDFSVDLNDPNCKEVWSGHIANVAVRPNTILIKDSKTGHMNLEIRQRRQSGDKDPKLNELLAEKQLLLQRKTGDDTWHDLTITTEGPVMTIQIDGQKVGSMMSAGFAHPTKCKLSLTAKRSPLIDSVSVAARPPAKTAR